MKKIFRAKICVPAPLVATSVLTQNKGPGTEAHFWNPPPLLRRVPMPSAPRKAIFGPPNTGLCRFGGTLTFGWAFDDMPSHGAHAEHSDGQRCSARQTHNAHQVTALLLVRSISSTVFWVSSMAVILEQSAPLASSKMTGVIESMVAVHPNIRRHHEMLPDPAAGRRILYPWKQERTSYLWYYGCVPLLRRNSVQQIVFGVGEKLIVVHRPPIHTIAEQHVLFVRGLAQLVILRHRGGYHHVLKERENLGVHQPARDYGTQLDGSERATNNGWGVSKGG